VGVNAKKTLKKTLGGEGDFSEEMAGEKKMENLSQSRELRRVGRGEEGA